MRLRNFTPHPVTLAFPDGGSLSLPSEGAVRLDQAPSQVVSEITTPKGSIPLCRMGSYGAPYLVNPDGTMSFLPKEEEGVLLIVSGLCLGKIEGRSDLIAPGTGPNDGAIRGPDGRIKAVTRLISR